jgi:hypothetical protein
MTYGEKRMTYGEKLSAASALLRAFLDAHPEITGQIVDEVVNERIRKENERREEEEAARIARGGEPRVVRFASDPRNDDPIPF